MPVRIQFDRTDDPPSQRPAAPRLAIGLVNNMAGAAFESTERQFVSLLEESSDGIEVSLSLYTLPGMPVGHCSTASLFGTELDGLLVTGREPVAADLREEPYWQDFVALLDWAREHTLSAIWSCLAAHAAVLHRSGIRRRRSPEKCCGVFACAQTKEHPLTQDLPPCFPMPHSRWNGLHEADLAGSGYRVLTRTAEGDVDCFVEEDRGLFVFLQGHPEYDADTLGREYRRDVARYLRHQSDAYPCTPLGYFDSETEGALIACRDQALALRSEALLPGLTGVLEAARIDHSWRAAAVALYRNWLKYLCARKAASAPKAAGSLTRPKARVRAEARSL